ncbi:RHS repeat-associated core domain-containing protein [Streptomyces lydicus]
MVLPQTDITLPGSLPLSFTRTFESSYRTGRWFGPTWMSTVDQRLEIDAEGVILIGEEGDFLLYPHPAVGVPTRPIEGDGAPLELTPDGDYVLSDQVTGIRRYFTTYTDGLAVLDEISDRHGNHHTFDYTEDGTPTAITHSAGYRLQLTTDAGRITALHLAGAAPDGSDQLLVTYGYDELGNLASVTNSSGLPLRFTYDDAGRITSWTDTNNSSYHYVYDDQDRCTSQGGIAGHLSGHFTWGEPDPETGLRTNYHRNSLGQVTTYQVNDRHQIVAATDPTGATTRTVRDAGHRILSTTDPLGRTTTIDYDDAGRPTTVTLPDGTTSTTTYNALGLPLTVTAPDGTTWTHTYDAAGNRISSTDPTGATTTYTYDARGNLAALTDALGNTTHLYCNKAGLPLSVTDPLGAVTHYRRDAFGRTTSLTDPLGETTHMVWTVEGKLAARIDPTGATEEWTYDGEGNRTSHTDAIGQTTRYEYGHFDLLTARTDPDGVRHEFTHDTELRLTQVTNPQGLTWKYTYDPAGRLASESHFDNRTLTYAHDPAGQLTSRINVLGEVTTYTRDTLGRITHKDAAGLVTTYTHDASGNLHQAANPDATVTYTRDILGRVTAETVNGRTMTFTYDALGRRTSRTTPTGHTTTYTYDAAGNRTAMDIAGHVLTFDHDATGQELTRTIGDNLQLTHTWDPAGRLTTQSLTTAGTGTAQTPHTAAAEVRNVLHRAYTYRPDGNLTAIDDSHTGRRTFDLDRAGRVTAVHATDWTETYAYDAAGNQTHATWPDRHPSPSARGERTYDGTNITRAGRIRYEHDALGRVTLRQKTRLSRKPDTWHYTWNTEGRLTAVITPDGSTWRYLYDPLGRRIAKQRLNSQKVAEQTDFSWDGPTLTEQTTCTPGRRDALSLVWDHRGLTPLTQTERKTTALDNAPQQLIDQRFFAIATDLAGSPSELVDTTGSIAWSARSTLWGTTTWNREATAYTPLRFSGQYFDPETQLHHNYFRTYDPATARYISSDPLGLAPSPNPVTYVLNPHTWVDPQGLTPCENGGSWDPAEAPYLYRGVSHADASAPQHWQAMYSHALEGRAVPHGGHEDVQMHVGGDEGTRSAFTSWTTDLEDVAREASQYGNGPGVVLRIPNGDGPGYFRVPGVQYPYEEFEVTIKGVVHDAEISVGGSPWRHPRGD